MLCGFFMCMGMNNDCAKAFYKSKAWQQCRDGYIKSVGGLCERCLKRGLIVPGYIVHHRQYITPENIQDTSITLNWDNLEYLCFDCHNQEHFKQHVERRYKIAADGSVTIAPG